ncbi:MAG TPA: PorV/PorQ family protein [Longimicrobiales bacterium]
MNRLRILLCAASLAAMPGAAAAQDGVGTASAIVLQLAPAPRPLALGGAYAAIADDALSLFYNAAGLSAAPAAIELAYQTLPVGASAGSLAAALPLGPGVLGAGVRFLNLGDIDVVEPDPATGGELGRPTGGRVGAGEVAVSAGYGIALGDHLRLGATATLLRLQIAEADALGAAFDLGASATVLDGRLVLAAAAQHLGPDVGVVRSAPLPRRLRAGAAVRIGDGVGPRATLSLEAIARDDRVGFASGIEAGLRAPGGLEFAGRIGYRDIRAIDGAQTPFVFGAGITLGTLTVDYAFRPLGPLGDGHMFGISLHPAR